MTATIVAVRIFGLRYRYPAGENDVLRVPQLEIMAPGLTAITGPSGSGKSTLVELIAGTLRGPYSGDLEVLGIDLASLRRDADRQHHLRRIGLIPQDYGLLPTRTVRETLWQDLVDSGTTGAEIDERIADALGAVQLSELVDRQCAMLSGGQRQRVAIARMLARDVELVIADEPTANLDRTLVSEAIELFRNLAQARAVVIVTHDMDLAAQCDRHVTLPAPPQRERLTGLEPVSGQCAGKGNCEGLWMFRAANLVPRGFGWLPNEAYLVERCSVCETFASDGEAALEMSLTLDWVALKRRADLSDGRGERDFYIVGRG